MPAATGRPIVDLSFPVWELDRGVDDDEEFLFLGDKQERARRRLGTIRMALPLGPALDTADQIFNRVLWIVTLVNMLAMGVSLFYMRRILRPVRFMADATERLGQGQLGETVPVLSNDEMGKLALSFNRMSRDLAATTVSKDFLDSILGGMRELLVVTSAEGTIRMVNNSVCSQLGYPEHELNGEPAVRFFTEADSFLRPGVASLETTMESRSGRHIPVLLSVAGIGRERGEAEGYVVTAVDLSERVQAEENIKRSLQEKEILLKEIHHRVKNNLQVISSLLKLQSRYIDGEQAEDYFNDSRIRIESMALVHEKLYQSENLAEIEFGEYIRTLASDIFQSYRVDPGTIRLHLDTVRLFLTIDAAVPCGLLVNELVVNSLKHAFPGGREGAIHIDLQVHGDEDILLRIRDTGVGFPEHLDFRDTKSLGMQLVVDLTDQLRGTIRMHRTEGTTFEIIFPSQVYKKRI